ncbi:hypothetical protein ABZP36_034255 [Zizania latifolia]
MEMMSPRNPMRKYSWWWDSHICPKNSKWLQENLTDMDSKIKLMIKIIDEDADSFARRAEMYYRRRPELMSLLEELYRAYRALAERHDHAAGELRHAHQKIAEAFPDEFQLYLDDDLPAETSSTETDTDNRDMTPFFLSFINAGDSKKRAKDDQDHEKLHKEISSLSQENQELKKKISSVLEKSERAESEVLCLKEALAQQEAEKEAAFSQCQQSSDRLQILKSEILHTQEEFKRLKEEMQNGLQNLSSAEERCLLLERTNQNLHLELDKLKHDSKEKHGELNEKHVELEKLSISIQEGQLKSMQAEMTQLSLEKQLVQAKEKLRILTLEKNCESSKRNDIEESKVRLQNELERIREENHKLDEQNNSSTSAMIHLQDEVFSLKNVQKRLKEEVSQHVEEKKVLQYELSQLKDDKGDSERKHFSIKEQIQVVNFNVESLQAVAQEVRDGNVELKEIIKHHEGVKALYVDNLMQLERTLERNAHLERSLSAVTTEVEGLRENKVQLEESCKHLRSKINGFQSERSMFISRIEGISLTMENISEKNVLLETLLSENNTELEILRRKLKDSEESMQALHNQNSILRSEKRALVHEVDNLNDALLNLEAQFAELEGSHLDLQQDKNKAVDEVIKLQELLRLEREEHKELTYSGKTQFSAIQRQLGLLLEEGCHRENELQEEHKIVEAQTEIFVLQRCLADVAEESSNISGQLQKQKELCKVHEEKLTFLSQNNHKLTSGIGSVMDVLHLDVKYGSLDLMKLDVVMQLILHEIKCLLNTISDAQDVKQNQILEKSLVVTLLEHFGREVADLRSERSVLRQEWQAKSEELMQLQNEKHDLLKISCELQKEMEARSRTVDELKGEAKFLVQQLSELQELRQSLQAEVIKLIEENSLLSGKLYDSRENLKSFEDDFSTLLGEAVSTDILGVIFISLHDERTSQLQSLHDDFGSLHAAGNELYQEIRLMNKKLGDLQLENNYLEKELSRTLSICDSSGSEIATGRRRTMRRDTKLLKSGRKSQQEGGVNMEQRKEIDHTGLEKSNEILREKLHKLQSEVEVLRSKEQPVIDVKSCDAEITKLLSNMQMATANAALFKEKVLELLVTCESFEISEMVQKEILKEEITRRNSYVDALKNKLTAVEIENMRLKVDLNGDFTLLGALQAEVNALEKQTMSLAKDCLPSNKLRKEEFSLSPQLSKIAVKPSEDQNATKMVKDMELQKLHGTIKALQKVVTDTGVVLEQERLDFNSNLQDARKQIEMLKLKDMLDSDASEVTYEKMLKDIQLDLVQTPSRSRAAGSHRHRRRNASAAAAVVAAAAQPDMLGMWSVVRASSDGRKQHDDEDLRPPQSEAADPRDRGRRSTSSELSQLTVVKDLSVDKQEVPRPVAMEPHREWKKKVIERLSADAQRLVDLQSIVRELRASAEAAPELEDVTAQMVEAEDAIAQLIDTNGMLLKKAEEFTSADGVDGDLRSRSQRKILERVRKMSEKIGRLEQETQRFQQALLRHEEERAARRAAAAAAKTTTVQRRSSRVQLVEYLYGRRRDSRRQRRGPSCCMRAKAIDD